MLICHESALLPLVVIVENVKKGVKMRKDTLLTSELIKLTGASYTQINYLILSGKLQVSDKISGRRLFSTDTIEIVLNWLNKKQEKPNNLDCK